MKVEHRSALKKKYCPSFYRHVGGREKIVKVAVAKVEQYWD